MLLTKDEIKALIDGVWTGKYTQAKLPYWLFDKLADGFQGAAVKGWGNNLGSGVLKDLELEKSMQENLFYFAANKTAHQLQDMHNVLQSSTGKYNYVKNALKVNEKYNNFWYDTEYNVTQRITRAGREWRRIEAMKELYPKLRFIAVQDGNTRKVHAELHGIIRPVEDPIWKKYFPPLDWNCRCRVERLQQGANTNLNGKNLPPVVDQFNQRVTDSGKIWHESHPYFSGLTVQATKAVTKMVEKKVVQEKVVRTTDYDKAVKNTEAWAEKAKPDVLEAFKRYTGSAYEDWNRALRGLIPKTDEINERTSLMIKNFPKAPKFEGVTYRNFGFGEYEAKTAENIITQLKSGLFMDEGFFSTAYKENHTGFGGGRIKFMVKVNGKNGFALDSISQFKGEKEVLFNTRTKFKVTNYTEKSGQSGIRLITADLTEI